MTSYYPPPSSYKPPVRQEGFHLPSPAPSNANNPPSPTQNFDINHQLFLPQLLSDPFRKFNGDASAASSMDFGDELASLIAHSPAPHTNHQSSQERSTQSPVSSNSANVYDDNYRPPTTHNIFDISAPTANHSHQQQQSNHNGYQNQFQLPQNAQGEHQPSSFHPAIHEYNPHPHFNSTLPALNSTMRYDPQPPPSHDQSFPSHFSPTSSDYSQVRHSPSPVRFGSSNSRSRSRSRLPPTPSHANEPISTNGGPTRTIRRKRNSISSTSPPPPHRTPAIVIPTHRPPSQHTPTSATSPLSLHSLSNSTPSGWFVPTQQQQQQHEFRNNEYNLPTQDNPGNHQGFSQFNPNSVGSLGVSPKDVSVGKGVSAVDSEDDTVSRQAMLAVEKRRRRRESHNAVERRRRDNINERIAELATLIPDSMIDPNAPVTSRSGDDFLFGITGILGLSNPLGSEGLVSMKKDDDDKDDEISEMTSVTKKSGGTNGTHTEGGIVKANKGMILRKSVEYIKYLQQLVSAQGSRNRDLEQELAAYRQGHAKAKDDGDPSDDNRQRFGDGEDMNGLVLHEDDRGRDMNGINEYSKVYIQGLELASMPDDQDMDMDGRRVVARGSHDTDNLDDPHSVSGMEALTSPSAGSGSGEGEDDRSEPGAELNRGRARTMRIQPGISDEQVKVKSETQDMET